MNGVRMRRNQRKNDNKLLTETIKENPFVTDEELAEKFTVSVQTIRLRSNGIIHSGIARTN